jgi:hypothetical protein
MDSLVNDYPEVLLAQQQGPCLSIYQTTHRHFPQNKQDPIRFRNLLQSAEDALRRQYPGHDPDPLITPLRELVADAEFWNHTGDGLAVLSAPGSFRIYSLQRTVPERMVVGDSFYFKPLARIVQSADVYQILGVSRQEICLFEGNRDVVDEVALAPGVPRTLTEALGEELTNRYRKVATYGGSIRPAMHHGHHSRKDEVEIDQERFFRTIDRAILEHHSRPSGLPLVLAALPEHHALFRRVSHNPQLIAASVDAWPRGMPLDELRRRAWAALEPFYLERLASLVDSFGTAAARGLGTDDLATAVRAAIDGRVDRALIDADRQVPGHLDRPSGRVIVNAGPVPEPADLLDDLAELVIRQGGEVVIVPSERMPSRSGLAAILRY